MDEFGRIALDDAVGVAHAELMVINQQAVTRRLVLEEGDGSFDYPSASNKRPGQEGDDAEVSDKKGDMMFFPGPP